jgi:hypothetical protein
MAPSSQELEPPGIPARFSNGRTVLVEGPVQVPPLAADLDVSFVDAHRAAMGFAEAAQPALDQRRVGQDPAVQGGVVDRQAALPEQLLDVTIAQRLAQIPGDGLQDQRSLEVAAFEVALGPALQLLDKGVQDHGATSGSEAAKSPAMPNGP